MSRFLNESCQAMKAYTPGEQPKDMKKLIKLNTNENPYPPSDATVAAITKEVVSGMRLYNSTDALQLRSEIASRLGVEPENVLVANGSDEVLSKIFLAYSDLGARFPDITYGFYSVWAKLYGAKFEEIPLCDDFTIDPDDYTKNDRMTVFANPNAPTGISMGLDGVKRILDANPDYPVVVDEAYVDFGGESAISLLGKYDNLIIIRTFSKFMCMAGARLGYAVAGQDIISDLEKIKFSINPYDVNTFTQKMGVAAMRDFDYYVECAEKIKSTREYVTTELRRLDFTVLDSKANFVFASPPDKDGARCQAEMRKRGILIRHFNQNRICAFNRVSIGTTDQMNDFLNACREVYQ